MNFSGTKCDECGRIKGESNHWHQIAVIKWDAGGAVTVELGSLGARDVPESSYNIHDLCGEQCLWKHIGKLLRINPATEAE